MDSVAAIGFCCIDSYEGLGLSYPTGNGIDCIAHLSRRGIPCSAVSVVGTDENGGSVVYARSGGETEFTAIPVETGMETDYYIEISGEGLSDGMEVKTSANDTATAAAGADDAQQSGENAMFSMDMGGGMPGGDMPGGGGMPSGGPGGM